MAKFNVVKEYDAENFEGWSGGKTTLNDLIRAYDGDAEEVFDKLYYYLDDLGLLDDERNIEEGKLNDLLWFDRDTIYEYFGLDESGDSKEDDEDESEEDDETEDSIVRRPRRKYKDNSPVYSLRPEHERRQSYYGKAYVETDNHGTSTLYSYDTKVAEIKNDEVTLFSAWDQSATTLRHVKEFLKQHGFRAETMAQIRRDYKEERL